MRGKIVYTRKGEDYFLDDVLVTKKVFDEAIHSKPLGIPNAEGEWRDSITSYGAGCHPKRIKQFEEYCRRHNVPTDFTTHRGLPVFRNRVHRKQVMKLLGLMDRNSFTGY